MVAPKKQNLPKGQEEGATKRQVVLLCSEQKVGERTRGRRCKKTRRWWREEERQVKRAEIGGRVRALTGSLVGSHT